MLGMFGIIVADDQIQNTIRITQEIKPGEKYMVQFLSDPTYARVCQVEEIQQWLLFPNQKMADNWLQKSVQQAPGGEPPREPMDGDPNPPETGPTPEDIAAAAAKHAEPPAGVPPVEFAKTPPPGEPVATPPPVEEQLGQPEVPTLDDMIPPSEVPGDPSNNA